MNTNTESFTHEKFGTVEAMTIEDEIMFYGKGIATTLQYTNPNKAVRDHVDSDDKVGTKRSTLGGVQDAIFVNESGLYSLILRSKMTEAKQFKQWVTKTVLPSIRNNGGYIMDQENKSPEEVMAHGLIAAQNIIEEKTRLLEISNATIQDKNFPMSLSKMFSGSNKVVQAANLWLEDQGYIKKVFAKGSKLGWVLTPTGEELGYGSQVSKASIFWTPSVLDFLPSTKELLEFAISMNLTDHKL